MSVVRRGAILLPLPLVPWPALAASTAAAPAAAGASLAGELLRVVLSLAGVVVLILVAGWLTRRLQGGARPGARRLRCIESLNVGVKERVLLVQVGERQLLLGVAPGRVSTLHVLEAPLPEPAATAAPAPGFAQLLAQLRRGSGQ
ncbi:MAG: flagellar biosynthetic protein FliO [Mizugakiibacter sp.]|uniref:flagellar biosynthetic protein FliO n=1 Tax=Mizugakiibacter sp. TaxID=1972610 RepID=UPI0031C83C10|nr:flagellar biosynthetic protein FliO [Xanthomonadaceae bacterium]